MKLSFTLIALAFANESEDSTPDDVWISGGEVVSDNPKFEKTLKSGAGDEKQIRRYEDLKAIAKKAFSKAGFTGKNKFDERKYWTYGCHCMMLGDRPMSEMGRGVPVDNLDVGCQAYKNCQKCVRLEHGDDCIGEMVQYQWKYSKKLVDFMSRDAAGSCARELFECDLQFVKDTLKSRDAFNKDYHMFWTTTGFDAAENCEPAGVKPVDHQCCGGHDRSYVWMGMNNKQCCPVSGGNSGVVKHKNESC